MVSYRLGGAGKAKQSQVSWGVPDDGLAPRAQAVGRVRGVAATPRAAGQRDGDCGYGVRALFTDNATYRTNEETALHTLSDGML